MTTSQKLHTNLGRSAAVLALALAACILACAAALWPGLAIAASDSGLKAGATTVEAPAPDDADDGSRGAAKPPVADGLYNIRSSSDSSLSVSVKGESVSAKAAAVPADRDTSNWSQKWLVVQDEKTGCYTLRNLKSRLLLTVSGTAKKGAAVKQLKQSSSKKQLWQLVKERNAVQFLCAANPKLALALVTVKGQPALRLQAATTARTQRFRLGKAEPIESNRSYFVRSAANAKKALAVKGASKASKAQIVLAARNSGKEQKFRLQAVGAAFTLQNVRSCLYAGASKGALTQTAGAKGKAKRWSVTLDLKSGTFSLKSASAKKYVDARSGKLALRGKAKTPARTRYQRFVLVPTHSLTVFVDAGHGRNASGWGVYDPGAQGNGYDEADLTRALAGLIVDDLEGTDVRALNGSDHSVPYWQRNAKARSLGCDVVVSVHFDAGGGNSTATMVSTNASAASRALNSLIHRKLVSSIGLRDGGTMRRSDITVVNGALPAVLMEVCFVDNYSCLHKYLNRKEAVAAAIADGIVEASRNPDVQR